MEFAVCTLSSDEYIKGTQALLYSFLKNNEWFNGDFVVLHGISRCALSQENQQYLKEMYSNVKFVEVKENNYRKLFSYWNGHTAKTKMVGAYKFDMFLLTEYDKILYIDSDCIVNENIESLFKTDINFGAVINDYSFRNNYDTRIKKMTKINTGVMIVEKKSLGKSFYVSLFNTGVKMKLYGDKYGSIDYEVLNERLFSRAITFLPSKFNVLKRTMDVDGSIYHFINKKPWESIVGFEIFGKKWTNIYNKSVEKHIKVEREKKPADVVYEKPKEEKKKRVVITKKVEPVSSTGTAFKMEDFEREYLEFIASLQNEESNN